MSTLFVNPAQIPEAKVPKSEAACLTWLRLMRSENVGPITFLQLINRYDTVAEALAALPDLAARGGRRRFSVCTVERAEAEWEAATRAGAHMLCLGAPDYPRLLAEIDAPPPLLWARGRRLEAERVIGIVGARNASAVGTKVATMLASGLAA
ncbi:MAG: DNA-processing protein DprA, partial [Pseudomonadota bacterium]